MSTHEHLTDLATWVYVLSDFIGRVIYVGLSSEPERRFSEHKLSKSWWYEVKEIRQIWFPDRMSAMDEERNLIMSMQPVHNLTHNGVHH